MYMNDTFHKKVEKAKEDKRLTAKQARFVQEYVRNGGNATQAAIDAGYSEVSAAEMGSENLRKPHVGKYLNDFKESCARAAGVTYEWQLDVLRRGIEACLSGETNKDELVNTASLSSLIAEMNKMLGHYKPAKTESTHAVAMTDDSDVLDKMLDSFEDKLKPFEREY